MKVLVSYDFIFEPAETWAQFSQFDADFASFLSSHGLEAEVVKTTNAPPELGMPFKRVLFIKKKEDNGMPQSAVSPPEKSIKQVKADLQRSRGYDGKFKT